MKSLSCSSLSPFMNFFEMQIQIHMCQSILEVQFQAIYCRSLAQTFATLCLNFSICLLDRESNASLSTLGPNCGKTQKLRQPWKEKASSGIWQMVH